MAEERGTRWVPQAVLGGLICSVVYASVAFALRGPITGHPGFVRHEALADLIYGGLACGAWAFASLILLAVGRRRLFVVPVLLVFAWRLILPLGFVGWDIRSLADAGAFAVFALAPSLLVRRAIPAGPREALGTAQRAAVAVCVLVGIAPLVLYVSLGWHGLVMAAYMGAFATFGAGVGTRKPGWPWAQGVLPILALGGNLTWGFFFGEAASMMLGWVVGVLVFAYTCYVSALWAPLARGFKRIASSRETAPT